MENTIDLVKLNDKIKTLSHPFIFLFLIITFKDDIGDNILSIMVRLFLKYHKNIGLEISIFFENELDNFPLTYNIISKFYILSKKRILLLELINDWSNVYDNKYFNNLCLTDQIIYIKNKQNFFKSIFDCSYDGIPFYCKFNNFYETEYKYEILKEIEQRLLLILNIFNVNIFKSVGIPLMYVYDFYNLSFNEIMNYLSNIYNTFSRLLNDTLTIFISYEYINSELYHLLNPLLVTIETIEINDSESELLYLS